MAPTLPDRADEGPTLLERVLRHERSITASLLVLVLLACWGWIVALAHDMYGTMDGASAWMMVRHWDAPHLLLLCAMWVAMMIAMMLPSAVPVLLLYAGALRGRGEAHRSRQVNAMAAGYLLAWTGFSVAATALQWLLARLFILTPMMEPATRSPLPSCSGWRACIS